MEKSHFLRSRATVTTMMMSAATIISLMLGRGDFFTSTTCSCRLSMMACRESSLALYL